MCCERTRERTGDEENAIERARTTERDSESPIERRRNDSDWENARLGEDARWRGKGSSLGRRVNGDGRG